MNVIRFLTMIKKTKKTPEAQEGIKKTPEAQEGKTKRKQGERRTMRYEVK